MLLLENWSKNKISDNMRQYLWQEISQEFWALFSILKKFLKALKLREKFRYFEKWDIDNIVILYLLFFEIKSYNNIIIKFDFYQLLCDYNIVILSMILQKYFSFHLNLIPNET
jgi:hypothetical protein